MNKKTLTLIFLLVLSLFTFGCGNNAINNNANNDTKKEEVAETKNEAKETQKADEKANEESKTEKTEEKTDEKSEEKPTEASIGDLHEIKDLKVATIKGPTAMSVAPIMEVLGTNLTVNASIEEQVAALKKGDADLYFIPSNLYAKLKNSGMPLKLIYSNAGNVLSFVGKDELKSVSDLKGKTIALMGRGAIPEIILNKLLEANGLKKEDINPVFLNEPTEAVAAFKKDPSTILFLPQPFATAIKGKIEGLKQVLDIKKEWTDKNLPQIITSVIVAKKDVYEAKKDEIIKFTYGYVDGVSKLQSTPQEYSDKIQSLGIVPAKIAEKAIPQIEFVSLTGKALTDKLTEFFNELLNTNPELIGGKIPDYEI